MEENVTLLAAFGAGLLSFISPLCAAADTWVPLVHLRTVAR
jgi:cytochrome c biogenesis protein CcdA